MECNVEVDPQLCSDGWVYHNMVLDRCCHVGRQFRTEQQEHQPASDERHCTRRDSKV